MFLPLSETGQSVTLPGLAPDPAGGAPLFPPGTYPIMGSGEFTATLYPLADPMPPPPMPLPPEVTSVALPIGASAGGIPSVSAQPPLPAQMPYLPEQSPGPAMPPPGLSEALPTSVMPFQMAWPPMPEPTPQVPLYPPQPAGYDAPQLFPAQALPMPEVPLPGPAFPTEPAQALLGSVTSGMQALAETLQSVQNHDQGLRDFRDNRSVLRAPVPENNLGQVLWERHFGNG